MWKMKLIKRSKSTESLSNRRVRVGAADEMSKKVVPVAPRRTRKPEKPVAPVVPPRPTEKALANAKRPPTRSRDRYVELHMSGSHATQQDAQGKDQKLVQNSPPVKDRDTQKAQTAIVTNAASKSVQRSPPSSRETFQVVQVMKAGNATTAQCDTRTASENGVSSVTVQRSPSLIENKSRTSLDDQGSSSTLPRAQAPRRATVPQVVSSATSSTQFNSTRRDRNVIVINSKEAEYKTRTSWVSRVAQGRSYRNSASTKSEYYSPEEVRHPRPSRPPSVQVAPTGATSLRTPPSAKRSEPPRRPEPPKNKLERPFPLPRDKLHTQSLPPSLLTSGQQKEADIAGTENEYEYIHCGPRHVIGCNGSANTNLYTDNVIQSGMMSNGDPGIYTALTEMTLQVANEYAIPSNGLPKSSVYDDSPTESTSPEGEIYYTTMNPVISSTPDSVECDNCTANQTEEDEYVLPETSADYMNVPSYQIPTSPQSYDSGVCCSSETNTVDESSHTESDAQSSAKIEPYAEIRRAS